MALKNFRRHWALQRGETELVGDAIGTQVDLW